MNENLHKAFEKAAARVNSKRPPLKAASGRPEIDASEVFDDPDPPPREDSDIDDDVYDGLDWNRVPHLQKRPYEHSRGSKPSWIYLYGWPVWHREQQKKYWLCRYCHTHKRFGGEYNVGLSTSSAASHLAQFKPGHGYNKSGKITKAPADQTSILAAMQMKGTEVSQEVANELAGSFNRTRFLRAVTHWIADDNQSLRAIEKPSFRALVQAANPLAESYLWKSHVSLRDHIIAEYKALIPAVVEHLHKATTLIHLSFDNWTSTGNKKAITGICVHHLDEAAKPVDYLLGLPVLHGQHSGANIGSLVSETLKAFEIDRERVGYFVLDNATNNDVAVEFLAEDLSFYAPYRRLRCTCHILNLAAQVIIWGKDKDSFENEELNINVGLPHHTVLCYTNA